ncbi:hypothetical protein ACOMHN_014827 [Nucella lapillus]
MVIVRRTSLKFVLCTRTYHSADCDTDHSLVCSKIRLLPEKILHNKQAGKPRIDTTKMQYPEKVQEFANYLKIPSLQTTCTAPPPMEDHSENSLCNVWEEDL